MKSVLPDYSYKQEQISKFCIIQFDGLSIHQFHNIVSMNTFNIKMLKWNFIFINYSYFKISRLLYFINNNYPMISGSDYRGQADNDDDDFDDLEIQNSFENGNEIFQLRSQVHSLKIEKERRAIQHQRALKSIEVKQEQLQAENRVLKKQRNELQSINRSLSDQIAELKNTVESINRKTADFHRSVPQNQRYDPRDVINELMEKQKIINTLKQENQLLKQRRQLSAIGHNIEEVNNIYNPQLQKQEQEIDALKQCIEELKKKQISYKREYEKMLEQKQDIIKKMSIQGEQSLKKSLESRDKFIEGIQRDMSDYKKKLQMLKHENQGLLESIHRHEEETSKLRLQYKRKQENMHHSFEIEKEELTKMMNEKMKKYLQQKEGKLKKAESRIYDLENQMLSYKQQISKQKSQISSLQQLNIYLQSATGNQEQTKNRIQEQLSHKEQQIQDLRNKYFEDISQLKQQTLSQKTVLEKKIKQLETELNSQKYLVSKYQEESSAKEKVKEETMKKEYGFYEKQISKLNKDKEDLREQLALMTVRYKEKSQKVISIQKNMKNQYQQRIQNLQKELLKEKRESIGSSSKNISSENQSEFRKLQMIIEHQQIDKEEKSRELSKAKQKNLQLQETVREMENKSLQFEVKYRQKKEDYETLEKQFDELGQKYKKGVKDLQSQIEQMGHEINKLRKINDRKKNQNMEVEKHYDIESKEYRNKIKELDGKMIELKERNEEQVERAQRTIDRLTKQIEMLKKQRNSVNKRQGIETVAQRLYENERNKLMEYIEHLEENNEIMRNKLGEERRGVDISQLESELKQIKMEYSESLTEINLLLQKYKKLQEIHIRSLAQNDHLKDTLDIFQNKQNQMLKENNRLLEELNSSYDQINKLNSTLMQKEELLTKNKYSYPPQIQSRPNSRDHSQSVFYAPKSTNHMPKFNHNRNQYMSQVSPIWGSNLTNPNQNRSEYTYYSYQTKKLQ